MNDIDTFLESLSDELRDSLLIDSNALPANQIERWLVESTYAQKLGELCRAIMENPTPFDLQQVERAKFILSTCSHINQSSEDLEKSLIKTLQENNIDVQSVNGSNGNIFWSIALVNLLRHRFR